jgi:hypothetical protein
MGFGNNHAGFVEGDFPKAFPQFPPGGKQDCQPDIQSVFSDCCMIEKDIKLMG